MAKTRVICLVFLTGLFSMIFLANKTGVATNQSKDRTGSPVGESQQCGACHSGGNFGVAIDIRLKDVGGNEVTEYVPFAQYTYEVELSGTGAEFGFQTVALIASNNVNAGNLIALSSNAKIVTLNSRKYGEQVTRSASGLFQMQWNAPASGSGDVKFYAAGIACNSNNVTSGDQAITSPSLTISETITGISENAKEVMVNIYPNPASGFLNIDAGDLNFNIELTDLTGKIIYTRQNIVSKTIIPVFELESGIYFLKFSGEINGSKRFIKE